MSNKLKWFTHDHDARNDDFIHRSVDKFGHFGYSAYFMLLEIMHQHGTGDQLKISAARLCLELRSRRTPVRLYLDFSRTSGKLDFTWTGDEVWIQIKKFRERHAKMKSNLLSKFREDSANLPLEGEGEGEGEYTLPGGGKPGTETNPATTPGKDENSGVGVPADQFESSMPDKPKRKGTPLAARPDPSSQLLSRHCENYLKHTGVVYEPNFGKEMRLAGMIVRHNPLAIALAANDLFFQEKDAFIEKTGRSFAMFKTRANVLMARANKAKASGTGYVSGAIPVGTRTAPQEIGDEVAFKEWDGKAWKEIRTKKGETHGQPK